MTAALRFRGRAFAAVLSLALLLGLVVTGNPGQVIEALDGRGLAVIALVVALYIGNGVLKALRWWVLLRGVGRRHRFGEAYRAFLVGMSVSNLLPTGLAGEPVRLARLEGGVSGPGLAATAADRALDAVVIAVAAAAAVPLVAGVDPDLVGPLLVIACLTGLAVAVGAGAAWRRLGLAELGRHPGTALAAVLLTLPIQANDALRLVVLADLYGADVGFWRALAIVGAGTVAGMLTVVGAGAGLAATTAALVAASGASTGAAAAVGLVFVATSTWISFPLGAAAAWAGRRDRVREEARWT